MQDFFTSMPFVWLAIIVLAAIVEAVGTQLVSIWFVAGGIVAVIAAALGADVWLQVLLFAAVSIVLLVFTRPLLKRFIEPQKAQTNADRYVGMQGVVIQAIDNTAGRGQVKVRGSVWSARAKDGAPIPAGANVRVLAIEGVKLLVTRLDPAQQGPQAP